MVLIKHNRFEAFCLPVCLSVCLGLLLVVLLTLPPPTGLPPPSRPRGDRERHPLLAPLLVVRAWRPRPCCCCCCCC